MSVEEADLLNLRKRAVKNHRCVGVILAGILLFILTELTAHSFQIVHC